VLADRERAAPWADLPSALRDVGDAPVRLLGDLDVLDGRQELLHRRRLVRLRRAPTPGAAPAASQVFPACGPPAWTQATLERCDAAGPREQPVTVTATLEADACWPREGLRWPVVLDLEGISVTGKGGGVLAPPTATPRLLVHQIKLLPSP
jgi:hypothetical protein